MKFKACSLPRRFTAVSISAALLISMPGLDFYQALAAPPHFSESEPHNSGEQGPAAGRIVPSLNRLNESIQHPLTDERMELRFNDRSLPLGEIQLSEGPFAADLLISPRHRSYLRAQYGPDSSHLYDAAWNEGAPSADTPKSGLLLPASLPLSHSDSGLKAPAPGAAASARKRLLGKALGALTSPRRFFDRGSRDAASAEITAAVAPEARPARLTTALSRLKPSKTFLPMTATYVVTLGYPFYATMKLFPVSNYHGFQWSAHLADNFGNSVAFALAIHELTEAFVKGDHTKIPKGKLFLIIAASTAYWAQAVLLDKVWLWGWQNEFGGVVVPAAAFLAAFFLKKINFSFDRVKAWWLTLGTTTVLLYFSREFYSSTAPFIAKLMLALLPKTLPSTYALLSGAVTIGLATLLYTLARRQAWRWPVIAGATAALLWAVGLLVPGAAAALFPMTVMHLCGAIQAFGAIVFSVLFMHSRLTRGTAVNFLLANFGLFMGSVDRMIYTSGTNTERVIWGIFAAANLFQNSWTLKYLFSFSRKQSP